MVTSNLFRSGNVKNYLSNYIKKMDNKLNHDKITKNDLEEHLIKINFFQHERLIHLLVTLFYGLFTIIFILLTLYHPLFFIITIIVLIFLIFYVIHYFFLENSVQYLYKQYDLMKEKILKK